ncbi:minor capsid protein [Listeria monocytogenes]|uniref:Minor capsid protein n=1 Tax=Listeria monocytogenes TaxID=1639 RepID=A0A823DIC8_LISMN|nr:minor capsid protein [Listeria monocytogenes]EKA7724859.1 minor capsid protein [Listeria innocua]MDA50023.1 minor capsid protein [Listeria monocytogenes serotype 1/2b]EAA0126882.1 minor capsid protein [Listeria monocytogenes]EAA0266800.1 minor capsid protein [Listeria monocytogenes]EAA0374657.1 minor capsid protein [Listeria monocytogenes]
MPIKVRVDLSKTKGNVKKAKERGQFALINQAAADISPYVPFLDGDLSNQYIIMNDKEIMWTSIYARRLYKGINFNFTLTHHPLAGPEWDQRAKVDKLESWIEVAQKAVEEGL